MGRPASQTGMNVWDWGGGAGLAGPLHTLPAMDHRQIHSVPIRRVLVPVEFDACSRQALRYAASLAQGFEAQLDVVHALTPTAELLPAMEPAALAHPMGGAQGGLDAPMRETLKDKLDQMVKNEVPEALTVTTEVCTRHVDDLVSDRGREVDLIVMGTHEHSWFDKILGMSRAKAAVERTPRPLLVVPGPGKGEGETEANG